MKLRSALTSLSLAIGSGSIIAVLGIGMLLSGAIANSLNAFGDPGVFVSVDADQDDPQSAQLRYADALKIRDANPTLLRAVYPGYQHAYRVTANGAHVDASVISADGGDSGALARGRFITAQDNASARRVCVLSASAARRLFGAGNPLQAFARINGVRFAIIGVEETPKANLLGGRGPSDYVEIPYAAYHAALAEPVAVLRVVAQPGGAPAQVREAVLGALRRLHGKQAAYTAEDARAEIAAFKKVLGIVSAALGAIDGIALLIAGTGVMNVMLASVAERTREIGVRKALGASKSAIFRQFLGEAVRLSSIGCVGGALAGCALTAVAHAFVVKMLGPVSIPWLQLIALAVAFSFFTGILFGVYPALRACALEPVRALRA